MTASTDLIETYFARAAGPDVGAYVDLFAPHARVEDDGHTFQGTDAVRRWRADTVPVRDEVLGVASDGNETAARVRISGEFDGSPVVLMFRFGVDDDGLIVSLTITPAVSS